MSKTWTIERPASIVIRTTVEAETLEQALEIADQDYNAGHYAEILDTWHINFDRYWAEDKDGEQYTDEDEATK